MSRARFLVATFLALGTAAGAAAQSATTGPALAATAGPPTYQVNAPAGAPNVVVVLLDDVGFAASSVFGGPVQTPTLEAMARDGLRYNRFHTTAICSPTRASLLTGRNPHNAGIGAVENTVDPRPGYSGFHTKDTATIAEILRLNGYNTAAFGKWHQTPDWESSQSGPFDRWPTGEGFERFYGFMGGETDQFDPTLYEGTTPIMRPPGKDYTLNQDLADKAIAWLRQQHAQTPNKPAFLYFAPGATHAPLQAPREWIDRYRGKFDMGWDKMREIIFARQKALGVIPATTKLTPRDPRMPAWDSLTPDQKKVAARLMEVYAGFLAQTDAQIGRIVAALKANGEFDHTLFFYIVGDNGASAEGGLFGSASYMGQIQGMPETDAIRLAEIDKLGGRGSYAHYPAEWAWAMDTPLRWTKAVASHLGGTRNAMVVTWPDDIKDRGGLRSQFAHVNDIAPTILEAAHIAQPGTVDGVKQKPMDGTSMIYSFADPHAPGQHHVQYFEVFGHRAIYKDGWMASAFHQRLPWETISFTKKPFDADHWELYDLDNDYSQSDDVSAQYPARTMEMKALFEQVAAKNQVLPLENITPAMLTGQGLPNLASGRASITYSGETCGVPEKEMPSMTNHSWSVDATIDITTGSRGVVAAVGGSSAGWSIWVDAERRPVVSYRLFDIKMVRLRGPSLAPGRHDLHMDFDYDGNGYAKGATIRLRVDGRPQGEDHIPVSPASFFTIDETFDVGLDRGSPVDDYPGDIPGYAWNGGKIEQVTIGAAR